MVECFPKISIVTVSYNQGEYIEENILSVKNQKYPNLEHIIIDAGSTDDTLDVLKKYDENLNWISEPDKGQSDGLNKGFKKASGDIIGWFNSDDRIPIGALKKVARFFRDNPDEIAVIGNQRFIDENGNELKVKKSQRYTQDFLLNHAKGITQNSIFFSRKLFEQIGYIDESINYAMDRDFFIRVTSIKDIPYIDEILGEFRFQDDAKTAQGTFYFAKELIKIRKKYGGKSFSPGNISDWYIILTEPLRRRNWLRKMIQNLKSIVK